MILRYVRVSLSGVRFPDYVRRCAETKQLLKTSVYLSTIMITELLITLLLSSSVNPEFVSLDIWYNRYNSNNPSEFP